MSTVIEELNSIFKPRSIAVVGASSNQDKLGYVLVKGFVDLGFEGALYPINPDTNRRILNLNTYASVNDVPGELDLVVITLPPQPVPEVVEECIKKNVKGIIIFSAFPEGIGPQAPEIKQMLELVRQKGIRIIGPNSMGIYSPSAGLAIFADMPKKVGSVGFISHSGATAFAFSHHLGNRGVGFSKVVACGNEWDLTWTDFLEHLGQDPDTEIIAGYIEGVKDGARFVQAAKEISSRKPIILLKAGKSSVGSTFVSSHTGSIAGNREVWSSVFEQTGIISVDSLDDLVDHVIVFNYLRNHNIGDRVVLISGTGGPAVISADLCEKLGLKVPSLSKQIRRRLDELLPPTGTSSKNPVDVSIAAATNFNLYTKPTELLNKSDEIDALVCIHTGDWRVHEIAKAIAGVASKVHKPLMVILPGTPEIASGAILILLEAGIPAFTSLEGALKAYASLVKWRRRVKRG